MRYQAHVNRYTYRAEWCPEYHEYIGSCVELPFLSQRAPTLNEAIASVADAVDQHLDMLRECGEEPPPALTERTYSGKFVVRTSRALHARLAIEATEQRISMNQLVVQKLAGRPLGSGIGPFGFD